MNRLGNCASADGPRAAREPAQNISADRPASTNSSMNSWQNQLPHAPVRHWKKHTSRRRSPPPRASLRALGLETGNRPPASSHRPRVHCPFVHCALSPMSLLYPRCCNLKILLHPTLTIRSITLRRAVAPKPGNVSASENHAPPAVLPAQARGSAPLHTAELNKGYFHVDRSACRAFCLASLVRPHARFNARFSKKQSASPALARLRLQHLQQSRLVNHRHL